MVHVFKYYNSLKNRGLVSRDLLYQELNLGEGTIKTLLKHLKMHDIIISTNAGTKLTCEATTIFSELLSHIPIETNIQVYYSVVSIYLNYRLVSNIIIIIIYMQNTTENN